MVKAFLVTFEEEKCGSNFYTNNFSSSVPYQTRDNRPIIVIANNIKEVSDVYPNAHTIMEWSVKEVKILDSVRIKCPVK
jgi:NADH:ubiquinone oxidoreductase subunit